MKDDVRVFKKKILWKTAFFPGVLTIIWAVSLFIISDGVLKEERQKEIVCIVGTILFFLTAYSFSLKKIIKYFDEIGAGINQLLEEEDYTRQKKHENKKMSGPVMVYWLIATAIYLAWSFTTNDWDRTWIIWPVVGVLFPAFYAIVNGIRKKS